MGGYEFSSEEEEMSSAEQYESLIPMVKGKGLVFPTSPTPLKPTGCYNLLISDKFQTAE